MSAPELPRVVTVTPNPAIDWTVMVPGFHPGAVHRVREHRQRAAGKGVNVAAALAGWGESVAAAGFLGGDNAAPFEALFAAAGIGDRFVRIAGETRIGIKIVDPARQQTTDVNFAGPAPAPEDIRALHDTVGELARPGTVFVLAGSLPPGVPEGFYAEMTRILRVAGCTVVVDTSGEPLRLALDAAPQIVKPNVHELESIAGQPLGTAERVMEAARGLLDGGVELAVVSMGAEGALFAQRGRMLVATPPAVRVGSTVGAGDAMVAGLVAGRLAGLDLADLARLATAFSLDALTRDHTDAPSQAAVATMREMVEVREV